MSRANLIIATRGSKLALTQTNQVADSLRAAHPGLVVELLEISTAGDRRQDVPLPEVGGKGLFTLELEEALLTGRADLAVHSLKDLPTDLADGLCLAATPARQDPHDAVVLPAGTPSTDRPALDLLAPGARVGTGSVRRVAMLRHVRPDLDLAPIRGNLDTRLRKLDEQPYDALILAAAGLHRMGWGERITALLPPEVLCPAPGQGALGLEGRSDDQRVHELLAAIHEPDTLAAVTAERAFLAELGVGCQVPCGAYATVEGDGLRLRGAIARPDGTALLRREAVAPRDSAAELGHRLATAMLAAGAAEYLVAD